MTEQGRCRVCTRWIALRSDGTVRGHGARTLYDSWCRGALETPVEVRPKPKPEPRGQFDLTDTDEL